jgi:deoxyribodipyrimidine photo-lyase
MTSNSITDAPVDIDWDGLIDIVVRKGAEVPEIHWCELGEDAAKEVLLGIKNEFLTTRLRNYCQ